MPINNRWMVVFAATLGLITSVGAVNTYGLTVLLKPVAEDLGLSRGIFASAMGISLICIAVATPIFGALVDRLGYRRCLLVAVPLHAAGIALLSFLPPSATAICIMFAATGVLAAGNTPAAYSKAVSSVFDSHRGLAVGIAISGVGIGTMLIPPFANAMLAAFGWRNAFLCLAAAILVVGFLPVLFMLREPSSSKGLVTGTTETVLKGLTRGEAVRLAQFWLMVASFLIAGITTAGTVAHLVAMLSDMGMSPPAAASVLSTVGAALIVGRLASGYILDKVHAPYVAAFFFACALAGVALIVTATSTSMAILGAVLVGTSIGADVDVLPYLISRYFGLKSFSQIYGILFSVFLVGNGLGPIALGITYDRTGSYQSMLIAFVALLTVAIALLLRLGPYRYPAERKESAAHIAQPAETGLTSG